MLDGQKVVLPKKIEEMTEQDFFDMPISSMDTQLGRMPQDLSVKFKDPQWAGYWFNKKAKDGQRVGVARAMGFVPAKVEEEPRVVRSAPERQGWKRPRIMTWC